MAHPTIRATAKLLGVAPSTIHRWRKSKPELYKACIAHARREIPEQVGEPCPQN